MNKKLFLLILIPAMVLIGAYIFIRYSLKAAVTRDGEKFSTVTKTDSSATKKTSPLDLRPLFIERLQQLVAKTSDNSYNLSVGKLDVDVLSSAATFHRVSLKSNKEKTASNETYALSFEKLEVKGINLDDAVTQKTMDYKLIKLTNPVFEIYRNGKEDKEVKEEDFTQRFLKEMKKLSVTNLIIEGGKIIIHNKGKIKVLNDVAINMHDILIDSVTRNEKSRFLFAKTANISFKNYKTTTGKDQYTISVSKVNVQAPEQKLTLSGFSFDSPLGKKEFSRRQKFAKEFFQFSIPSITATGVNWWNIINEEELLAKTVTINGGKLHVYLDRSLPAKSKMGSFPVQLLMKLPFKISVEHLRANNFDLAYEEFNPISKQSGTIYMDNVSMNISNVSNLEQKATRPVTVNATALFMHKIPIKADFVFSRANYKSGKFTALINSDKDFDGSLINSFSMPMGMVKIEEGQLQKLHADLQGNELKASGDIAILYKDLKLHLLEKDRGEKQLDKKGFTTFFANAFVLKKDNPKEGEEPRKAQAEFNRIPEGGFFMLVWKTIMTGALKTIGAPTKIANKTTNTGK